MFMNVKWVAGWQPVQAKYEKGGFVLQTFELLQLGHPRRQCRAEQRRRVQG